MAESARLQWRRNSQEELPKSEVKGSGPGGQTPHPRTSGCRGARGPREAILCRRPGAVAGRSYPMTEVRGGGLEEQPHVQGAMAVPAQEDREELLHVQG